MLGLSADIRYGIRLLLKSPGFTVIALCALALGIGANAAIFSVLDGVLLRPLPYSDPDRLVMVWEDAASIGFARNTPAPANYFDWRAQNHVFSDMAALRYVTMSVTGDGSPEQLYGQATTSNFFSVLGVEPARGRVFTEDEDRTGAQVAVISYGLWQRRYAGNPSLIDGSILLDGARYSVIGVMPRDFVFRDLQRDFWIPIHVTPDFKAQRNSHYLNVVARLRRGVTVGKASEEMRAIADRLKEQFPDSNRYTGAVVALVKEDLLGRTSTAIFVLMAAAGCVLLIACANLASLLLARAVSRGRELAVRAALGAGRGRMIRQMVTEGAILSLAGGVAGLGVALAGVRLLATLVPNGLPTTSKPVVDLRSVAFTFALSLLTGLLFSIVPAIQASRTSVNECLKQGGRAGTGTGSKTSRDVLVIFEVAAALVLLTGAGLMIQTMIKLRSLDLGFRPDHVLTLRTALGPKYRDNAKATDYHNRILAQVSTLPGVENAAFGSTLPFQSIGITRGFLVEGSAPDLNYSPDALSRIGTATYLQTLGVRLREGHLFDGSETASSPPLIIINDTFARHFWPNEPAIGHRISINRPDPIWRTVVGVVADVQERGYDLWMKPGFYIPASQATLTSDTSVLVIRTKGTPLALAPAIRRVVASIDPEQPVSNVRTLEDIVDTNVADRRMQMTLLGAFAGLALLLASIGLYGVLSYIVTQRRREIGLRMALGATAGSVTGMIVRHGLALTAAGLVIGICGSWIATRALKNLLYGVSATDPATFTGVATLLLLIAFLASWIPARRAAVVDPVTALREE